MTHDPNWHTSYDKVVRFARVLESGGEFETVIDALRFFEKPWNWTAEHAAWCAMGCPAELPSSEELREAAHAP